jgi:hypothetical protein
METSARGKTPHHSAARTTAQRSGMPAVVLGMGASARALGPSAGYSQGRRLLCPLCSSWAGRSTSCRPCSVKMAAPSSSLHGGVRTALGKGDNAAPSRWRRRSWTTRSGPATVHCYGRDALSLPLPPCPAPLPSPLPRRSTSAIERSADDFRSFQQTRQRQSTRRFATV